MRFFSLIELLVSFTLGALLFSLCFQGFLYFQPKNKERLKFARDWMYTNTALKEMFAFAKEDNEKRTAMGLSYVFDQGIDINERFSNLNFANLFVSDHVLKLNIENLETKLSKIIHLMEGVDDFKIYTLENNRLKREASLMFHPKVEGVLLEVIKNKKTIKLYIPNTK